VLIWVSQGAALLPPGVAALGYGPVAAIVLVILMLAQAFLLGAG
jgi:hypothetical protein